MNLNSIEPERFCLILGPERSGTTFIRDVLADHPNISILSDDLNSESPFFRRGIDLFTFGNATEREKRLGYFYLLNALASINMDETTSMLGCKMNFQYPHQAQLIYELIRNHLKGIRIVLVTREDLVAQYASFIRMHLTGVTHTTHSNYSYFKVNDFSISPAFFRKFVYQQLIVIDYLRKLKETHQVFELIYERDICGFNQNIANGLFEFLAIPSQQVHSTRQKKISPEAKEYVKNYQQLHRLHENVDVEGILRNKHKYMKKPFKNYYLLYKILTVRKIGILKKRIRNVLTKRVVVEQGNAAGDQ